MLFKQGECMYIILNYSLSLITLINQKIIHQSLCVLTELNELDWQHNLEYYIHRTNHTWFFSKAYILSFAPPPGLNIFQKESHSQTFNGLRLNTQYSYQYVPSINAHPQHFYTTQLTFPKPITCQLSMSKIKNKKIVPFIIQSN